MTNGGGLNSQCTTYTDSGTKNLGPAFSSSTTIHIRTHITPCPQPRTNGSGWARGADFKAGHQYLHCSEWCSLWTVGIRDMDGAESSEV